MVIADTPSQVSATLARAAALAVALTPAAGWSLTAEEVWSKFQETVAETGQTLSAASETPGPGSLTLDGLTLSGSVDGVGSNTMLIEVMTLTEQADGSVRIDLPDSILVEFQDQASFGVERLVFDVFSTDLDMVATESGSEFSLRYTATSGGLRILEPTDVPEIPEIEVLAKGLAFRTTLGDSRTDSTGTADSLAVSMNATDADTGQELEVVYEISDIVTASSGPLTQIAQAIEGLPDFDLAIDYGAFSLGVASSATVSTGTLALTGGVGSGRMSANDGLARFASATSDIGFDMRGEGLPGPINWAAENLSLDATLPANQPSGEYPFALDLDLQNFTLGEATWGLFDPNGVLPRDPARLAVDLDGTAELREQILPGGQQSFQAMEPRSMTINQFVLDFAGAQLDATGALEFLGMQPQFSGMPALPNLVGEVSITLAGMDGLLQGLADIGLFDNQALIGARMMLGVVARPGAEPDTLESELEFTPDGGVIANGMRLR
ncbi:DUF2125 domain-containing protein [Dinoroseobacter sp. S124A]|uniref:DUF2125 domain-containing protein n=1 Tax=Dinoroseobacter sp. S124A TaxID=3415128 RepID=UPI003C7A30F9